MLVGSSWYLHDLETARVNIVKQMYFVVRLSTLCVFPDFGSADAYPKTS